MRIAKKAKTFSEVFIAYDFDGTTKLSGLTIGNGITITSYKDGVVQNAQVVTIGEVGSTGNYLLSTIFSTIGYWTIFIKIIDTGTNEIIDEQRIDVDVSAYTLDETYNAVSNTIIPDSIGTSTISATVNNSTGNLLFISISGQ
tara:strand:+ start:1533 stop:1961 length:429 start_codon:yes stop_codon:yes gene_type:complete